VVGIAQTIVIPEFVTVRKGVVSSVEAHEGESWVVIDIEDSVDLGEVGRLGGGELDVGGELVQREVLEAVVVGDIQSAAGAVEVEGFDHFCAGDSTAGNYECAVGWDYLCVVVCFDHLEKPLPLDESEGQVTWDVGVYYFCRYIV